MDFPETRESLTPEGTEIVLCSHSNPSTTDGTTVKEQVAKWAALNAGVRNGHVESMQPEAGSRRILATAAGVADYIGNGLVFHGCEYIPALWECNSTRLYLNDGEAEIFISTGRSQE